MMSMRKVGRATPCAAESFTDSSDGNLHNHHKDGDDHHHHYKGGDDDHHHHKDGDDDDHHYGERDHNCNNRDKA